MPYSQLPLEDVPVPQAGPGEVRIAVHYAAMSFAISLVTEGRYQRKPPLPFSPGTEIAGVIDQVASDVTTLKPGDRVLADMDWGGHAEFETVLVHGAAGAVGLAAVECARALGATVVATASTQDKLDLARSHGADHTILFPAGAALHEIRSLLPRGAEVVFDPIGGDAFDLSLRCVANSGRILVIGFAGGRIQQVPANIILVKDVAVLGFNFGNYTGWTRDTSRRSTHGPEMHDVMERIFAWYRQAKINPVVSHRFPLQDYRAAMETVLSRRSMGKVVLEMPIAHRG
jgi:NADPH2:quinone reductase